MKTITFFLLAVLFILSSCGKDDAGDPLVNEMRIIGIGTYDTPYAFLNFSEDPGPYKDKYSLFFVNGALRDDMINGISGDTSTLTHGVAFFHTNSNSTFSTINPINVNVGTYNNLDDDTTAFTNITSFIDTYSVGTTVFGEPDVYIDFQLNSSQGSQLDITSFTIDYATQSGTIECTYFFTDINGHQITGRYSGNFSIINGGF